VRTFEGPVNDNIAPIDHSIADTQIGWVGRDVTRTCRARRNGAYKAGV
jgi:hypothetical protein